MDFKTELKKYQPLVEIDEVEEKINAEEIQDVIDLLQYMADKR